MEFEWAESKAEQVKNEHAIEFAKIIDIFEDPFAIEFIDETHSTEKEIRYAIIGITSYGLVYLVFTEPDENRIRFITARRAENWMVNEYEENRKK
ncbi:MAG: BrnT family toxin [Pyrinomonadaceae bacterium]